MHLICRIICCHVLDWLRNPACAKPCIPELVMIAVVLYRFMVQWIRITANRDELPMIIYLEGIWILCGFPSFGCPLVRRRFSFSRIISLCLLRAARSTSPPSLLLVLLEGVAQYLLGVFLYLLLSVPQGAVCGRTISIQRLLSIPAHR
jgi:hypothetical protein